MTMQVRSFFERALRRPRSVPHGLRLAPQLSRGLPVLGHSIEFVTSTIELLFRAQRELGEAAALQVFNRKMVAMFGPEAHEAVFRASDAQLSASEAYKIMTPVFGKDVVYDAAPEKMAEQLKMLLPALRDRRMRTYGEAVVLETEQTIGKWGEVGVVDLVDFCRVLTNFTSSRCLLGREFREGMTEEFAAVYHDLERGVAPIAYINAHLPIPSFWKRDRARVRMVEMITEIVGARRREKREGEDFLQTLMDSRYADGKPLSEHEITGLLLAGMFAGHHTSSVTTAWTLIELLRNPETLARAVAEIDGVFGGGQPVSHQALRDLPFTENAVKEALRLHPPLFLLVRVAKQDFTYKEFFIPAGTWIVVSPTVSHRMAEVFPEPDRFDPDRFAPPREEDKRDFAFIAFGGGRHKCLGNAFAILQIKAILTLLLGQYDFELAGDAIVADFQGLVVGPKEPCRVRYRRRAQPSVSTAAGAELARVAAQGATAATGGGCPVAHPATETGTETKTKTGTGTGTGTGTKTGTGTGTGTNPTDSLPLPRAGEGRGEGVSAPPAPATTGCPVQHSPASAPSTRRLTITLDRDLCQGHAVCVGEAPEVFHVAADGKVEALLREPPPDLHASVRRAAAYCPTRAIRLDEG
ncbi:MAG: cytochrome P450 [Myxococcales bacterium]|nr:cytochrome P450 [Myxococcales bacterium]